MSVVHIVMFAYAPSLSADDKSNLAQRFLALKEACRSQDSGQPYVVSVEAGANNSPEGLAKVRPAPLRRRITDLDRGRRRRGSSTPL